MRVNSFTVEGYKNLNTAVTFGPLGPISALHGPNNIGKSNLLAALDLFFGLLAVNTTVSKDTSVSLDESEQIKGHPFAEIFNATDSNPIRLQVELSLPREELERSGLEPECETDPTTITLELTPVGSSCGLRVTQFQMAAQDVARDGSGPVGFGESLRAFISGTLFGKTDQSMQPFTLIDPYGSSPDEPAVPGLVPQSIRDALFDARQALDLEQRGRWQLFQQVMRLLEPELGPGEFDTSFDRASGRANLVYLSAEGAMPVDRLGAGAQRLVALLGSLVLARATVIGLSEPELGLSPTAQGRFLGALNTILSMPGGPAQVLLTTHSPVLGGIERAFVLEAGESGRTIVQRPCDGAVTLPDDLSLNGLTGGAAPGDLDQLIGLVDQLSEIEPEALVAAAPAGRIGAGRKAEAGAASSAPADSAPGTPAWKYQPK